MEKKYYVNCTYYPPRKRKGVRVSLPLENYYIPEGKTFEALAQLFAIQELRRNKMNRCKYINITLHSVDTVGDIVMKSMLPEKTIELPYAEILCCESLELMEIQNEQKI